MSDHPEQIPLPDGLNFSDLYDPNGLARIDEMFVQHLGNADAELASRLSETRANTDDLDGKDESALILELSPHLESFLIDLFGIGGEQSALIDAQTALDNLYACKRLFVQRKAVKAHKADAAAEFDGPALESELAPLLGGELSQDTFANTVMGWLEDEDANEAALDLASRYAAWATWTDAGKARHSEDIVFYTPGKVDPLNLVPFETSTDNDIDVMQYPPDRQVHREGFTLTDNGTDLTGALDEANYCVICHERERDSCNRGLRDKKTTEFIVNDLGTTLAGCPLCEKISEMHQAKMDGNAIAALAIITVDNPMVAGTGHRICNDCMKACIYQKQDPVDIPQAETRILKDVLELPWGFEIYSLLTRWNPLNLRRPLPATESGYKVLVVGLGPSGFTLAHHLMNEGHTIVAIDGLKIEPLEPELCGVSATGERVAFQPVRDIADICENLDERPLAGFGGVAEYGITVRWDKNFLKIMRLMLERREQFAMFGGVRFGSTITDDLAHEMGFDHIALCMGAGKPTFLPVPNGLARGVRQASDFLMALQLTGAAKKDSIANLQIRLPVVVIGGGLTAIDTATEALAYYIRQVEKFSARYQTLVAEKDAETVRSPWTDEEAVIADEYLGHATAIAAEQARAKGDGDEPNLYSVLNKSGGSTIAYRRRLIDSPSYTLNHEEVNKAFEQGIKFSELLSPIGIDTDEHGHASAIRLARQEIGEDGRPAPTGEETSLPARTILIAAGTQPNTVLAREHEGFSEIDGKFFQAINEDGQPVTPERMTKPAQVHVLMRTGDDEGASMSFFGDLHPSFAGNVVKAMASAKQGYPVVDRILATKPPTSVKPADLIATLNHGLRVTVREVIRLTPTIIEVILHAPMAADAFQPGQFFRLQNYEANAMRSGDTTLAMEGLALTGAWVDREQGLVSTIVLEMGGSSNLCAWLKPGEPVILMGPTGAPTETPSGETVLLAGGGLGNAVLFSIGQAFRKAGSKVLYFGAYKKVEDRYHVEDIEAAADVAVWCCDEAPGFEVARPQDKSFVGNVVQAMAAYATGELGETDIPIGDVDRIIAIGSDRMMEAVGKARHEILKEHLNPDHIGLGSINSPMQCMMKEICAQCLQPHKDPDTGEESVVFSCFNQDQPLDRVQFPALRQRLCQNAVHEKLTRQWITHCLENVGEEHSAV